MTLRSWTDYQFLTVESYSYQADPKLTGAIPGCGGTLSRRHEVTRNLLNRALAVALAFLLTPGDAILAGAAQSQSQNTQSTSGSASKIPIALYPDPLLAQALAAATYPLEIIQLQQWLAKNPGLKDKALSDAVAKEPWDPSVQALAGVPEVAKRLADDIQWTTELGNAFLAQQTDVMDAVQRMRKKAQDKGNLKSTEQQKVETRVVENKTIIVVEQANPQVVYVPSYDPVVGGLVRCRCDDGCVLERWLGLGLWLGQQRHHHQQQQQFQPQLEHQRRQPQ